MIKIGLVTVLYKSDDVLEGFFKSISSQHYKNYILYIVDNSVNDITNSLLEELMLKYPVTAFQHIKSPGNIGVAAGNNAGAKQAFEDHCSHVLLLNNDIETEQDNVFTQMVSLCEGKMETMVVPKIFYYDTRRVWMAGGYMDKWRALGVHYGYDKKDAPGYNVAKYISYAPTCFMIISKKVFDKIGNMDEKYFAYYDDVDFVLRATRAGFKLYYDPSMHILHKVSSSAGSNSPFYVYYSNRNKLYFIRKNLHGFQKYFALCYAFASRVVFYLGYDKARKKKLIEGFHDGLKLAI